MKFKIKPKTVLEDIIQNSIKGNKSATSYSRYIKKAITKTKLKRLSIILEFGLGDAAQTALLYGTIITISVPLKEYLNRKFGLRYYKLNLTPNFNEKKVNLDLDCIIYIKLGHIIIIGIRILVHKIKGGEINGRTSYRKYNDNHYGKYKGND